MREPVQRVPRKRGRPPKEKPVETPPVTFAYGDAVECGIPGCSEPGVIMSHAMVGLYWVVNTRKGPKLYLPSEMRKVDPDGQDH